MENNNVDKGWEAMRSMLDREMPVKKRRRAAWWWLTLLLLPAAILTDWWYYHSKAVSAPQSHPPTLAQTNASDAGIHSFTQNPAEGIIPLDNKGLPANNSIGQYKQKRAPITRASLQAANIPQIQASAPESDVKNLFQQPALVDMNFIKPMIAGFPSKSLAGTPLPVTRKTLLPDPAKFKPYWEIGATSVASTEQFNNINGFSTGVTADWAFSRKWGLRAGLMYNIHTPQASHRPVATVNADDYASNLEGDIVARNVATGTEVWNMPGMTTLADSLSGNVYIPVSRLQRIELPVMVYWQARRSIKVFSGFSVSKTLITRADRLNYSGEYQLTLNNQIAEEEISTLSSHQMNTWNANALLGIGIRLSPAFELGINGSIPLQRYNNLGLQSSGNMINQEVRIKAQRTPLFGMYGTLYF